jgi:hypothetical protein
MHDASAVLDPEGAKLNTEPVTRQSFAGSSATNLGGNIAEIQLFG